MLFMCEIFLSSPPPPPLVLFHYLLSLQISLGPQIGCNQRRVVVREMGTEYLNKGFHLRMPQSVYQLQFYAKCTEFHELLIWVNCLNINGSSHSLP